MQPRKTCLVVMGFGQKTDFETGRLLDLDASYRNMIKPAVEDAGFECVRADEIVHPGVIDALIYEQLLKADLVIADVSTANANAFYELGVRHALRPYTTIIISEHKFKFPFDIGPFVVRQYNHLGSDIGYSESLRFTTELKRALDAIFEKEPRDIDSPVYTFIDKLRPPEVSGVELDASGGAASSTTNAGQTMDDNTHAALWRQADEAKKRGDFVAAKSILQSVRRLQKASNPDKPEDAYVIQQLALATYKSKQPTPLAALEEARDLLLTLAPETSNDTETLGLWGAVHKRLWEETKDRAHLDEAVRGYGRGFYLRNDYYNGINLAFMFNVRAANAATRAEAVADFVEARRVRREVLDICEESLKTDEMSNDSKFWVVATMAEALLGVGDEEGAWVRLKETEAFAPAEWMKETVEGQLNMLRSMLADSPLKYVAAA